MRKIIALLVLLIPIIATCQVNTLTATRVPYAFSSQRLTDDAQFTYTEASDLLTVSRILLTAGTATAGTAPLKIPDGTNLTTPEDGAVEHSSDNLNFTAGSTRYTLAKTLTATASLNFDLTSVNSEDLTITVTGAADGDAVSVGVPNASATANVIFTWWTSGTNTVTIRASRIDVASGADPASGTFRAAVIKY